MEAAFEHPMGSHNNESLQLRGGGRGSGGPEGDACAGEDEGLDELA